MEETDRIAEIANQQIAKMEATKKADAEKVEAEKAKSEKEKAESKDAASESSTETQKIKEELEAQVKEDERILLAEETDLNEDDKKRKDELIKIKEEKETPEETVKRVQESTQKRINELTSNLKAAEHARIQDAGEIKILKDELTALKEELGKLTHQAEKPDKEATYKKVEQERLTKYVEEDQGKPREDRREMSKEELDEWFLEDQEAAGTWVTLRTLRRVDEAKQDRTSEISKEKFTEFQKGQNESKAKLMAKFPECNQEKRATELIQEGKTPVEITNILRKENKTFGLMVDVVESLGEKAVILINGPELVMAEMEKRSSSNGKKLYTEEEVEKIKEEAAEMEKNRISGIDAGASSTTRRVREGQKSEFQMKQEEIAKKAGISPERLKELNDRRRAIPNVGVVTNEEKGIK